LTTGDTVLRHQYGFDLTDLGRGFPQPSQNRILFVAGGPGYAADTVAFGQLSERFDDVTRRGLAPIKHGGSSLN
jgi:hypothetical protein